MSPKEQFENAVKNYKDSKNVLKFKDTDEKNDRIAKIIAYLRSVGEEELAHYLVDCVNAYENIQFELYYQNFEYEIEPTTKGAEKAANKINALCHVLKKSAREYLPDRDVDFERERLLGIH